MVIAEHKSQHWFVIASGSIHLVLGLLLLLWGGQTLKPTLEMIEISLVSDTSSSPFSHRPAQRSRPVVSLKSEVRPRQIPPQSALLQDQNVVTKSPNAVAEGAQSEQSRLVDVGAGSQISQGLSSMRSASLKELYALRLVEVLELRKFYPLLAQRLGQQGVVLVEVRVASSGEILGANVLEESHFDSLNQAARDLISKLPGLEPFPAEIKASEWVFKVPIRYQL